MPRLHCIHKCIYYTPFLDVSILLKFESHTYRQSLYNIHKQQQFCFCLTLPVVFIFDLSCL